ncbi:GntR family transcriptional regulator [Brotaphodocola sp.]|uniref:GntR family transcriptional regulator n=1 Tax=Brotaphodocola sp. TaxID=3073577 RepID=UPI003D7D0164
MKIADRHPRENGRDYAMRVIRDGIISLELEPGAVISDRELAAEMNLSRTPVREALLELAKVKIVEIYPQRGSKVALIDYNLVEEAQFIRSVLETAVVPLVCEKATADDLKDLQENMDLQDFYQQHNGAEKLLELDNAFHRLLFQIAGRMQAYEMMQSMTVHFDRVRSMAVSSVKEQHWIEDHRQILNEIRENHPEEAKKWMEKHLSRYQVDETEVRAKYPQFFK